MTTVDRWLLPDGVEEVLPEQAQRIERLRRELLNLYRTWGYELVIPPLMEFTDSLLVGLGSDIDLLTFKVIDQLSGRTLGIRADITPQVARIDAHSIKADAVSRLCYAGSVLHTRPKSLMGSRSPIQLGAELYGAAGQEADVEIISLMLETLKAGGIEQLTLDLGHVGIYRALISGADLDYEYEQMLFDALQRKAMVDLGDILAELEDEELRSQLSTLSALHGDLDVLALAATALAGNDAALAAVSELDSLGRAIATRFPEVTLYFDLGELRGYHYHTGMVFAAYAPDQGQAVANGGRYDDVGAAFGRARPATGFNTDLKLLADISAEGDAAVISAIAAPAENDTELLAKIDMLRSDGETVIVSLGGASDARCTRQLVKDSNGWQVQALEVSSS